MTVKVEWRETGHSDLLAIVDYISDDNPRAAQQLLNAIQDRVAGLAEQPKLGKPGRVHGTRELVVSSNYIVVYAEQGSAVSILRVVHAAQQWPSG